MPWSLTQRDMEHWLGLKEVTMIRLPLAEWASPAELEELEQIANRDPLQNDWVELQSKVARGSPGFADWLRRLTAREWIPNDQYVKSRLDQIDFSMPWCARLRWGAGNVSNVDVFIHATGGSGDVEWETI
jgi:hypothetical protein